MPEGRVFTILKAAAVMGIVCTSLFLLVQCFFLLETFAQVNKITHENDQDIARHPPPILKQLKTRVSISTVGVMVGFTEITFGWIGLVSLAVPYLWSYGILQVCNIGIWCAMFGFLTPHSVPVVLLIAGCVNLLVTGTLISMIKTRRSYDRV